jgi:hypothetical protein
MGVRPILTAAAGFAGRRRCDVPPFTFLAFLGPLLRPPAASRALDALPVDLRADPPAAPWRALDLVRLFPAAPRVPGFLCVTFALVFLFLRCLGSLPVALRCWANRLSSVSFSAELSAI